MDYYIFYNKIFGNVVAFANTHAHTCIHNLLTYTHLTYLMFFSQNFLYVIYGEFFRKLNVTCFFRGVSRSAIYPMDICGCSSMFYLKNQ
jgi:hypothetical protein